MDTLLGHQHIKNGLRNLITHQMVGNAFLFCGPEGVGKSLYAKAFAKELLCGPHSSENKKLRFDHGNHPDLHILKPEGKMCVHTVESLRALSQEVALPPYESDYKVFIIEEAHCMLPSSSNALLKTFEEPSLETVIILVTHQPSSLLDTIYSRCRTLRFFSLSEETIAQVLVQHGIERNRSNEIAQHSRGSLARAMRLVKGVEEEKQKIIYDLFKKQRFSSYCELVTTAQKLSDSVEKELAAKEKALRLIELKGVDLSPLQSEAIEKEIQGVLTSLRLQEFNELLLEIQYWFRDCYLLQKGGESKYLQHPELKEYSLNYTNPPSLEHVQDVCQEAYTSLQRASKWHHCLEFLFLELFIA